MWCAEVAVLAPAPGPFTYEVPTDLRTQVHPGTRVLVPLAGRRLEGVVLRLLEKPTDLPYPLRPLIQILDGAPLPLDLLAVCEFLAEYYLISQGEALRLILPTPLQARRVGKVQLTEKGQALFGKLSLALLPPDAAELSGLAIVILQHLGANPSTFPIKESKLGAELAKTLGDLSNSQLERTLTHLAALGLVARTETVKEATPGKREEVVAPVVGPAGPKALDSREVQEALGRSRKRKALWQHLVTHGPTSQSELTRLFGKGDLLKPLLQGGLVTLHEREVIRESQRTHFSEDAAASVSTAAPPSLTSEQEQVLVTLLAALENPEAETRGFLLHGVTGSGKTEVYLRLIEAALAKGRTALVLVPEIGLTPQLAARFRARFGNDVAVLHSGLSPGEKADALRQLSSRQRRIALGPRSALFAPLSDLGVLIVDEEHDPSFKQQEGVRYNGRDVALVRGQASSSVVVLGSATPSLEALYLCEQGKLGYLRLSGRPSGRPMPKVSLIDLKQHLISPEDGLISGPLQKAMEETLVQGEQTILFLNRRGYATFLLCKGCGHRFSCPHCAVTLTWHKERSDLLCHYCGHVEPLPDRCPICLGRMIERLGLGTQRIEEQIHTRFPGARVARLDRDTASGTGLSDVLSLMHKREIDILIGTQMLTKGHDFPFVTLVGVVLADTGIGLPDFRASERTFQLLSQVAGRAGRAERPGQVLIQTYCPEHPAIRYAVQHDYDHFAKEELASRLPHGYPPYSRLAIVRLDGVDPILVQQIAQKLAASVRKVVARAPASASVSVRGPSEAPLSRLKGKTRWQLLLLAKNPRALRTLLAALDSVETDPAVRVSIDIDPASTL